MCVSPCSGHALTGPKQQRKTEQLSQIGGNAEALQMQGVVLGRKVEMSFLTFFYSLWTKGKINKRLIRIISMLVF